MFILRQTKFNHVIQIKLQNFHMFATCLHSNILNTFDVLFHTLIKHTQPCYVSIHIHMLQIYTKKLSETTGNLSLTIS